jgi:hypothetical protein
VKVPDRTITRSGYDLTPEQQEEIWDRIPDLFQAMDVESNIRLDARHPERLASALVQHWHKQGRVSHDGRKWRKR